MILHFATFKLFTLIDFLGIKSNLFVFSITFYLHIHIQIYISAYMYCMYVFVLFFSCEALWCKTFLLFKNKCT